MGKHIEKNRVVVTGIGIITPIGIGIDEYWESAIHGKSGIAMISRFNIESYPTKIAGEVKNFSPKEYMPEKLANNLSRYSQLGLAAAQMAVKAARLDFSRIDKSKVGVSIGLGDEILSYYDEKTAIGNNNYILRTKPPIDNRNTSNII